MATHCATSRAHRFCILPPLLSFLPRLRGQQAIRRRTELGPIPLLVFISFCSRVCLPRPLHGCFMTILWMYATGPYTCLLPVKAVGARWCSGVWIEHSSCWLVAPFKKLRLLMWLVPAQHRGPFHGPWNMHSVTLVCCVYSLRLHFHSDCLMLNWFKVHVQWYGFICVYLQLNRH